MQVQRELRIVLRDVLGKLSKDVRFRAFCRHEANEGENEKKLMDFERMHEMLDDEAYSTTALFLDDVRLIRSECQIYCKVADHCSAA